MGLEGEGSRANVGLVVLEATGLLRQNLKSGVRVGQGSGDELAG